MNILEFENVDFSYTKGQNVLKNISFSISEGERVALLGLNGAGKSTLMLLSNGLLLPSKGHVRVYGKDTDSKQLKDIRKKVGLVFQDPDDQLFMPTVRDDVAFGPRNMKLTEIEIKERVDRALKMTETLHLADKSPFQLSGGQKKAVSIATVLSMSPDLLVLDEPTSSLDYEATLNFISIIEKFLSESHKIEGDTGESIKPSILLSTHDLTLAKQITTRAIILDKGEIIYDGAISSAPYPL